MKRHLILLSVAFACLTGCHHLGDQEAYTVIDEEEVAVQQPAPAQKPVYQPVMQQPVYQPVMAQPYNCLTTQRPALSTVAGCQVTPVAMQPQMIRIPEQSICIK